jgi:hypothetical protein
MTLNITINQTLNPISNQTLNPARNLAHPTLTANPTPDTKPDLNRPQPKFKFNPEPNLKPDYINPTPNTTLNETQYLLKYQVLIIKPHPTLGIIPSMTIHITMHFAINPT